MPSPSFYPLVVAAGLPFLGYAAVYPQRLVRRSRSRAAVVRHVRLEPRAGNGVTDGMRKPRRCSTSPRPRLVVLVVASRNARPSIAVDTIERVSNSNVKSDQIPFAGIHGNSANNPRTCGSTASTIEPGVRADTSAPHSNATCSGPCCAPDQDGARSPELTNPPHSTPDDGPQPNPPPPTPLPPSSPSSQGSASRHHTRWTHQEGGQYSAADRGAVFSRRRHGVRRKGAPARVLRFVSAVTHGSTQVPNPGALCPCRLGSPTATVVDP